MFFFCLKFQYSTNIKKLNTNNPILLKNCYICFMGKKRFFIYILVLAFSLWNCGFSSDKTSNSNKNSISKTNKITKIECKKNIHDFGKISQGDILACNFFIKNTGDNILVINKIDASCGCTTPKWKSRPVPPGESIKIEVEFNSEGRYGRQYKVISIFANIPNKIFELIIMAEIN